MAKIQELADFESFFKAYKLPELTVEKYLSEFAKSCYTKSFVVKVLSQVKKLLERGCPWPIAHDLLCWSSFSANKLFMEVTKKTSKISFLPVIPAHKLSLKKQTQMIRYKNNIVCEYGLGDGPVICLDYINERNLESHRPYYILEIDDGTDTLGQDKEDAEKFIKDRNRLRATTEEMISIAIHTDTLSRKLYMHALGSLMENSRVPSLVVFDHDWPVLSAVLCDYNNGMFGYPSLKKRFYL